MLTHTHTHTHNHRQPDGAVCRACPIKLHPLVKKMYGCNALPHTHTNTYTHQCIHSCKDACTNCKTKQHNSLSRPLSLSHIHTHGSNFHHLIYLPPQQMQDAEGSSAPSMCPFGLPPPLLFPLHLSSVFSQPSFPLLPSPLLPPLRALTGEHTLKH